MTVLIRTFSVILLFVLIAYVAKSTIAQVSATTVPSYQRPPETHDTQFLDLQWKEMRESYSQDAVRSAFTVGRCMGRIEERFQTPIPLFWQTTFIDFNQFRITRIHASRQLANAEAKQEVKNVLATNKLAIYRDNASTQIDLPPAIKKFLSDGSGKLVTAAESKASIFIAIYGHEFNSFELYCLDKHNGNEKWKTMIQQIDGIILSNGTGYHAAEVHASDTSVVIFGASTHGHYMESLDADTGKKTAGFNTNSR